MAGSSKPDPTPAGTSFTPFGAPDVEKSVPDRFAVIASRLGDRLALISDSESMTYSELDRGSSSVANGILRSLDDRAGPVATLLTGDGRFLQGILGILKAGRPYVPLDAAFPEDRTRFILEDSAATALLVDAPSLPLARRLLPDSCELIPIDALGGTESLAPPIRRPSPDDPAVILYTSGSTGRPKGVLHNHRNLLHNCMVQTNTYHLSAEDRLSQLHSCSVMGSVRAIFNALLNGASVLPLEVKSAGLGGLRSWLQSQRITIYHSTASLFRRFASILAEGDAFPALRLVILGGEAATRRDLERVRKHFASHCLLCTGLGSTETMTVRMLLLDRDSPLPVDSDILPPGYPVEGMHVEILDESGRGVGTGTAGDIAVRGAYVALGYWEAGRLKRDRFATLTGEGRGPDQRLYRTGDRGMILPDGCLVHLGRGDDQVKVAGFRVELAEVEAALRRHPEVVEAAVVAAPDGERGTRLVGYVERTRPDGVGSRSLREQLGRTLPGYMIPSAFVYLSALPVTPSGKVDRSALPPPPAGPPDTAEPLVEARSPLEASLLAIWEDVLGISPIGIHDRFFDLGGQSLDMVLMVHRIEATLGRRLPMSAVFRAPTVATLARDLECQTLPDQPVELVSIHRGGRRRPLFWVCASGIGGVSFTASSIASQFEADQPVYGLQPDALLDDDGSLEEMASRFIRLMKTVQDQGPYSLGGYSTGGLIAYEVARQLLAAGAPIDLLAMVDTSALPRPPLPLRLLLNARTAIRLGWRRGTRHIHGKLRWLARRLLSGLDAGHPEGEAPSELVPPKVVLAARRYVLRPLPVRVVLFRAADKSSENVVDPQNGWDRYAEGGVQVHSLPCDHHAIIKPPHIVVVGHILRDALRAREQGSRCTG